MPANPSVGLVMIVKNEAETLPRLAASLAGHIDRWTIVDTGSTDDTVAVVRRVFAGTPGEITNDIWRGFGPSRTVALRAAEPHTDWLLTLDADETLHGRIDRSALAAGIEAVDAVEAENRYVNLRYWLPRLVHSGRSWRWQGRAHEYLTMPSGLGRRCRTETFHVVHHADGGSRGDKLERELALLLGL